MSEGIGVFQSLRALFSRGAGVEDPNVLIFHVRCDRCGELTRARADRRWGLLQELGDGVTGYMLHKEVLGMQCTSLMRIYVAFDRAYKITNQP